MMTSTTEDAAALDVTLAEVIPCMNCSRPWGAIYRLDPPGPDLRSETKTEDLRALVATEWDRHFDYLNEAPPLPAGWFDRVAKVYDSDGQFLDNLGIEAIPEAGWWSLDDLTGGYLLPSWWVNQRRVMGAYRIECCAHSDAPADRELHSGPETA